MKESSSNPRTNGLLAFIEMQKERFPLTCVSLKDCIRLLPLVEHLQKPTDEFIAWTQKLQKKQQDLMVVILSEVATKDQNSPKEGKTLFDILAHHSKMDGLDAQDQENLFDMMSLAKEGDKIDTEQENQVQTIKMIRTFNNNRQSLLQIIKSYEKEFQSEAMQRQKL